MRSSTFLFLTFLALVGGEPRAQGSSSRPNVLLIIWDDPNLEHFGFLGNEAASTPTMDALATGGIRFTRGVTMPRCGPALSQLLSGKASIHPRNGVCWNGTPDGIFRTTKLLPQILFCPGELGACEELTSLQGDYWTFAQGKVANPTLDFFDDLRFTHGKHDPQLWRFVDPHCTENTYTPCLDILPVPTLPCARRNTLTGKMGTFFNDVGNSDRPWFMWIVARLPHSPFDPPQEFMDRVDCTKIDTTGIPTENLDDFLDQEHKQLALTAWMDDRVGELLFDPMLGLGPNGLLDDTWVVNVVGDNGYTAGKVHKGSPYRAGTGCWISFWRLDLAPELAGAEWDFPVDALDVPATILDLAGKAQPSSWSGESLRPVLEIAPDPSELETRTVYSAAFTGPILDGDPSNPAGSLLALHATTTFEDAVHHYVYWYRGVADDAQADAFVIKHDFVPFGSREVCQEELYDLELDPDEANDLLAGPSPPPELQALAEALRLGALQWWYDTRGEVLAPAACALTQ